MQSVGAGGAVMGRAPAQGLDRPPEAAGAAPGAGAESPTKPIKVPRLNNWKPAMVAQDVFSAAECDRIIASCGDAKPGRLLGQEQEEDQKYRNCDVVWLEMDAPANRWIYQRTLDVVQQANNSTYKLDIIGFTERLQVLTYHTGGYIDWHIDIGPAGQSLRKLSYVIQLTDQADYEGGAFEIFAFYNAEALPKTRGSMILFPSYLLHRVAAVTAGARRSVVGWVGGPPYR